MSTLAYAAAFVLLLLALLGVISVAPGALGLGLGALISLRRRYGTRP